MDYYKMIDLLLDGGIPEEAIFRVLKIVEDADPGDVVQPLPAWVLAANKEEAGKEAFNG